MSDTNKKKSNRKYWILATLAIIFLLIIVKKCGSSGEVIEVSLQQIERQTIVEKIPANGKIQPVTEVKISPDVSGEIIELNVKEGDKVTKGDLIIKIKQDIYISAVEQASAGLNASRAAYKQQEAQYNKAKQNFERNKKLYELKTISEMEYENACAEKDVALQQLHSAKYNISSAEAQLREQKENLVKTTIYAPMDGIVSKLSVEKGERVVGTTQMAGTEMLRIADFSAMEVLVDVNENDIVRLKRGDAAQITIDAYPDREFFGFVTEVANSAGATISADQATTFEVKVRIAPTSYGDLLKGGETPFRPGMSASVQISTSQAENAIVVPLTAVASRKDLEGNSVFVYDKKHGTVSAKRVKTGLQDMNNIEIKEGLEDSMLVVVAPFSAINKELTDKAKVKIKPL